MVWLATMEAPDTAIERAVTGREQYGRVYVVTIDASWTRHWPTWKISEIATGT